MAYVLRRVTEEAARPEREAVVVPEKDQETVKRPGDPPVPATAAQARHARLSRDFDGALGMLAVLLADRPDDPDLRLEQVRVLLDAERPGEAAEAAYAISASAGPGMREFALALVAERRGARAAALRLLAEAAEKGYLPSRLRRALLLLEEPTGTRAEAADELRVVFTAAPDSASGLLARGVYEILVGRVEDAKATLGAAVAADPLSAPALRWLAQARILLSEDPASVALLLDAAERLGERSRELLFARGLCHLEADLYTLAIRDFLSYLAREPPTPAAAFYNIACAHSLMRNRDQALRYLGLALDAGFADLAHARRDPDLENIRRDPGFERLLRSKRAD